MIFSHASNQRNSTALDSPVHNNNLLTKGRLTPFPQQSSCAETNDKKDFFLGERLFTKESKSRRSGRSASRPIPISSMEAKLRAQEKEDCARAELWYRCATWQLHARIVEYRERNPLPEAYFALQESNNNFLFGSDRMKCDDNFVREPDRVSFPCDDEEDDAPFMIFDLDMSEEEPQLLDERDSPIPRL